MSRPHPLPPIPKSPKKVNVLGPAIKAPVPPSPSAVSTSPTVKGGTASFFGLLASKRLARRFASRVQARRRTTTLSQSSGPLRPAPQLEPTYRMEPKTRFSANRVQEVVKELVDRRLDGFAYSAKRSAIMSKVLSEEIKDKVKTLNYDRYKIVCVVTVGEKKEQGLYVSSRCSWNPQTDMSATYTWQNASVSCCVTVYGVYHE